MRNFICTLTPIIFFCYSGCRDGLSDCFRSNGKEAIRELAVAPFSEIHAYDGLQINITQGDGYLVTIKAGSNTISDIRVSNVNGILSIKDDISCEWSRKYEEKEVTIQCPDLRTIHQNGYGHIQSAAPLMVDSLLIIAKTGNGDISLKAETDYLKVRSARNGRITLEGQTKYLNVEYLSNNATFEGRNFLADQVKIFHKSNNSFHLYPISSLRGKLLKSGSVFLYHQPDIVSVEVTGKGEIIDLTASSL